MSEPVILVPLDGSKQALAALPVAKVLGEIERAALHILYVGELAGEEMRNRLGREAARRFYHRGPRWNAGGGNSTCRGGDKAASDRHVQAQWYRAGEDAGPHGNESAPRCSLSCGAGPAAAWCNTVASSPCLGAARWDTLHQRRTATRGGVCRTWSRRTAGGPRNGHHGCSGGAWFSHHATLCRSATARMARLEQRVCQPSRKRLPARPFARADIPRLWQYRRGNPALVRKTIDGPHRPRMERNMGSPSRGDPEGHSARGALSHNGGAHLKS